MSLSIKQLNTKTLKIFVDGNKILKLVELFFNELPDIYHLFII